MLELAVAVHSHLLITEAGKKRRLERPGDFPAQPLASTALYNQLCTRLEKMMAPSISVLLPFPESSYQTVELAQLRQGALGQLVNTHQAIDHWGGV